jgi:uncharacterized protein YuzE
MVEREITAADVGAVLFAPTKQSPGRNGCFVTLDPTRTRIITVANADSRIGKWHSRSTCAFDLSARAAYVKYAPGPSASTVDLDETGSVAYDLDAGGTIVGIEILEIRAVQQWEQKRRVADGPASLLLRVIADNPDASKGVYVPWFGYHREVLPAAGLERCQKMCGRTVVW